MSEALDMLAELAETHRRLATFPEDAAKRAAPLVEAALRRSAAAGESPDGRPWPARKDDGGRPYQHAAEHITAQPIGPIVRVTLRGPDVFGHFAVRGMPPRPMLPDPGTIPSSVADALRAAADQTFERALP